jgi:hypothetical protein
MSISEFYIIPIIRDSDSNQNKIKLNVAKNFARLRTNVANFVNFEKWSIKSKDDTMATTSVSINDDYYK